MSLEIVWKKLLLHLFLKTILLYLMYFHAILGDDNHIGYMHHVHSHGHGDFGENIDTSSHIEQL